MPVGQSESRVYLSVAYGKLRLKCEKDNPKAVRREYEGKESFAIEYSWIEGRITKIFYKESADFGNSYEVNIWDGETRYNISFKENSRYCHDFLTKLPSLDFKQNVKITPWEMKGEDDKGRRGTSILQNDKKILNFFAAKVDEHWIYNHDFPEPASNNLNDKQWKKYLLDMQIFLQEYTQTIIEKLKADTFVEDIETARIDNTNSRDTGYVPDDPSAPPAENDDDLPF
jgi:hypothetical protein